MAASTGNASQLMGWRGVWDLAVPLGGSGQDQGLHIMGAFPAPVQGLGQLVLEPLLEAAVRAVRISPGGTVELELASGRSITEEKEESP